MLDRVGRLLWHYSIYMAANFLQRGLSFLLIPLYATYFTTSEFGAMDMLYQAAIALSLVTSLGLPQGLVRGFYLDNGPDGGSKKAGGSPLPEPERRKLLGALISFLLPVSILATGLVLAFAGPIARVLFHDEGSAQWVRLAGCLQLALVLQGLPLQLYKTEQRSRAFASWSLASFALIAGGNVFFIVRMKMGLEGMLWGNLLGVGGTGAVLMLTLLPKLHFNWEWKRLAPLFAFGLSMLPNLLGRKVLEIANRYMIPHWHGLAEVGLFSMGARVAGIMDVLVLVPFLYAWQPFFYSQSGRADAPVVFARVTHYFLLLMTCIFLALQVFQAQVLHFLGRGKFDAAAPVISLLVLAAVFNGLQYCVSAGIHLRKKLGAEMGIMAGAAGCNVLINFLLIPRMGAMGAAVATASAYFIYLAGTFALAQSVYPVPYLWRRGGMVLGLAIAAFFSLDRWESGAVQIPILIAFILGGPAWDLWRHGELRQAKAALARKWRPRTDRNPVPAMPSVPQSGDLSGGARPPAG